VWVREISALSLCETERSWSSLVDEVDVNCRHCVRRSCSPGAVREPRYVGTSWSPTPSTEVRLSAGELSRAASWSPSLSSRELSASAGSVRPPCTRSSGVAASRQRETVVRARRPVVRSPTPGKKLQERGPSPCPWDYFVCITCWRGLDRWTSNYYLVDILYDLLFNDMPFN